MPFGLRNAGATFQRFIDNLFLGVDFVFAYLDDLLVYSENEEQHLEHLEKVLKILHENNLKLSIDKCKFFQSNLDFLGFNISKDGIKPTQGKVSEIGDFEAPTDSKSLRRFLGMVGFYRHLIPKFADVVLPLSELAKNNPNARELSLNKEENDCFIEIKTILSNLTALSHPVSSSTHFHLVTDSSGYAVGAALHQMVDNKPVPIGFFSKKISENQRRESTFDRELLAAYLSLLKFKHMVEGRHVTIFTDHCPLVSAYRKAGPLKSDKQQRQMSFISCLLYTSPSPRDKRQSRMPSSA